MKRMTISVALFAAFFAVGLVAADRSEAVTTPAVETSAPCDEAMEVPWSAEEIQEVAKKCSTSSDCPNSKCAKGQCGACSTSSDCKFGKCSSGRCGSCSTSSDCGGWGKCSSGQCGSCSTSSDCGSFGSCSSGRCQKSPY